MSFQDFVSAVESSKGLETEAPIFGEAAQAKGPGKSLENVRVKYIVCYMSDPVDQEEAERIFTKSLQCQNELRVDGDICVFKEESHFDKEGEYCVAIKYAECGVASSDKPSPKPSMDTLVDIP